MSSCISILGSTGSIGRQTLDVVDKLNLRVAALTANRDVDRLEAQCRKYRPRLAAMMDERAYQELKARLSDMNITVVLGLEGLVTAASLPEADTVVTAVSGMVGLKPTLAAIREKKRIALANKETLVCAGELVMEQAKKYGADETDAARAGILHDITKALSPAQQQKLVDHWKLPVSPFEYAQAKLLHAKTGAAAAARIFGENNAVVSAIDYHTTGRAHMTLLEKIIYIADYMEPNRDFPGVDRLREAVWHDLDEGVLLGIDMTLEQLAKKGQPACADSLAARDWLIQTRKEP